MKQRTVAKDVMVRGMGLHSGERVRVIVRPVGVGTGIMFRQNGVEVAAAPELVRLAPLCTLVEAPGVRISTVEHLLAALHGLGVDNAVVEVEGGEVPILDGSALPWVEAIDAAGRVEQDAPRVPLVVERTVEVVEGAKMARAESHSGKWLHVDVKVDYAHPLVGVQQWRGMVDEEVFRREIAPARTFTLEQEIDKALAAGLIKGGGLDNAVVFATDGTVKNAEGLRFPDEPVRHKVLDMVGDLYMAGRPVYGRVSANMPGHGVNNAVLRGIVAN